MNSRYGGLEENPPQVRNKDDRQVRQFFETVDKLKKIMSFSSHFALNFGGNYGNLIRECNEFMVSDLEKCINDENVAVTQEHMNAVWELLNLFQSTLIYTPLNPYIIDLVSTILILINNWNNNIAKSKELAERVSVLDRLLKQHLSILEAINLLKKLIDRADRLIRYDPKIFDFSEHYMRVINEQLKKD